MFDIDYLKLDFRVETPDYTILPMYKESAIRGGMGQILRKEYCRTNLDCDICPKRFACVYANTMYSNFEIKPPFVTIGESAGFVLVCVDRRESFQPDESLHFSMTLFGKTITYFHEIASAIIKLGQAGIGKFNGQYRLREVRGTDGQYLFQNQRFLLEEPKILTIRDYIESRKQGGKQFQVIQFRTPCTIKHEGKYLQEFQMQAIMNNLCRRIYMLNCFIGNDYPLEYPTRQELPLIMKQCVDEKKIRRFSNHKQSGMVLRGIEGFVQVYNIHEPILDILLAGEIIHIGKNTRFGFGNYLLCE